MRLKSIDYMTMMKTLYDVNIVVSNNSWGGGGFSQALKDSIQRSIDAGIVFVAAAGNDGSDNDAIPSYPASYDLDGIISVAATTRTNWRRSAVWLDVPPTSVPPRSTWRHPAWAS